MARIMIVDDSPEVRIALTATLEDGGHTVTQAADGREALGAVGWYDPEAILLDINMPDINGIETLRSLRSGVRTRDVPVVMLTAVADLDQVQQAIAAGAQDYILKPWDTDTVLQRLFNVIEAKRYRPARQ